jgi:3-hydroxyacyl-[acyl-carrier-protein] dehydratase
MKIELNKSEILEFQQNKPPYLMIDFVSEVVPGKFANGYKELNQDEWFFKAHWTNDPNMPGMLQIEALSQMAALSILTLPGNKGKIMYLTSADNLKFFKKVKPNKIFYIHTKVLSYKRGLAMCEGQGKIDNEIACKAKFILILPDEILRYTLKNKK